MGREVDLVGRPQELEIVEAFLASHGDGAAALVLEGEAGIGKTALWESALASARRRGMRVLRTRCSRDEAHYGFAGLADLLAPAGPADFASLAPRQARALEAALLIREEGEAVSGREIGAATLGVLRSLAAPGPLIVAVDDVPWLDEATAAALAFAARRLEAEPVRVLLTRRSPGAVPGGLEQALAPERLEVRPLSFGAIGLVLERRLGVRLPRAVSRRLYETAAGNPLFALELARQMAGDRKSDPAALPHAIEAALGERLQGVGGGAARALLAAELSGAADASELARIAGHDGVAGALEQGLVTADRGRLRPAHPLLGAVAAGRAEAGERRELHLQLAAGERDDERRARHLALGTAGEDEEIAAQASAAAERALRRGAVATAVELARHAVRLTPESSAERGERVLALARNLSAAGDLDGVDEILEPAMEWLRGAGLRTQALLLLSDGGVASGADADRYRAEALREAGDSPALRAHVLACTVIAEGVGRVREIERVHAMAREAVALARSAGDAALEHHAVMGLMWMRSMRGEAGEDLAARSRELSERTSTRVLESAERTRAVRMIWRGELAPARELLERLLGDAERRGEAESVFNVRLQLCELALRAGDWAQVRGLLEEWSRHPAEAVGSPAAFMRISAQLAAGEGRAAEAADWAGRAIEEAVRVDGHWHRLEALRGLGLARLLAGEPEAAAASFSEVWEHCAANQVGDPGAFPVAGDLVEALIATGAHERAGELAAQLAAIGERQDHPWARATAARGRGLLFAAAREHERAEPELARAAEELGALGFALDGARARLAHGAALRRLRRIRDARAELERGVEELEAIGSAAWAARGRQELGRLAGRRTGSGLTATERRVAELVASGRANKEVAAELVVSVSAVERHLTRIYAKLGLRSRTQLAAALDAD